MKKEHRLGIICNINRAFWQKDPQFQLKNLVFNAQPGDLICVIGPVGSGKVCCCFSNRFHFESRIRSLEFAFTNTFG